MAEDREYFVGFDIGSSCLHFAVLNDDREVVYSPEPMVHFADPVAVIKEAWQDINEKIGVNQIRSTAFTGICADFYKEVLKDSVYVFDSVAIPKGAEIIKPDAKYIFHIGAVNSYFFNLEKVDNKMIIQEWKAGTKCGGGTGMLLEKQCRRLFNWQINDLDLSGNVPVPIEAEGANSNNRKLLQSRLEDIFQMAENEAEKSHDPREFLARCGIVIQSDLIHRQNEGIGREDNLGGLFKTVARNYKIDVLGSRQFSALDGANCAIATGGVLRNDFIKRSLENLLGVSIERPANYNNIAAIGAASEAIEQDNTFVFSFDDLDKISAYARGKRQFAGPLFESLDKVHIRNGQLCPELSDNVEVVLGFDGGSTTTKGVLVEVKTGRLLDKIYIKTSGDPEKSLKDVIRYLSKYKDKVRIMGVGATGSARGLYEKILIDRKKTVELKEQGKQVTDKITDEITCHALGIKYYDSQVDTIFEIGGQDMKYTRFGQNGTIEQAKMNYSCQAGSGQTLENMADFINLNVTNTLQEYALKAQRVPIIDSTCGVFMEVDETRLIAEGFTKEEIAAAILRATAASYFYKFVGGNQQIGKKCSAQGGPPLGKAFLAALAQVTNQDVEAYPHREIFGAWGQALDVIENIKEIKKGGKQYASAFRGWGLVSMPFKKQRISCKKLVKEKSCGMRDCQLEIFHIGDDQIISGGFCPVGNFEKHVNKNVNYVNKYHKIFEKHFKKQGCLLDDLKGLSGKDKNKTVGIKRSLSTLSEKGIWSGAFLSKLGFCPVLSPKSDKEIANIGVENSKTEFCIARKLATGHATVLFDDENVEYLFNPSFIDYKQSTPPLLKYCVYTESEAYILNDVLSLDKNKQINPILHFGKVELLIDSFRKEFNRLGLNIPNKKIRNAINYAFEAEEEFKNELFCEGDKFLKKIEDNGQNAYVGIGRDYVLLDPQASSESGEMFSQIDGLNYIPQIFLEHKFKDLPIDTVAENEYWVESVKIIQANLYVANHDNLYGIRMMNFACGPDSTKVYQEEKIHQNAGKPLLVLLTDAQTNNAPFMTRIEAHNRIISRLENNTLSRNRKILPRKSHKNDYRNRTWLMPFMGNGSYMIASAMKHFGMKTDVLPTNTRFGSELAESHIHSEVCYPLKGVVGDTLGFLKEQIIEKGKDHVINNYLIALPTASGPCRFGKYKEVLKEFMHHQGLEAIPLITPSAATNYDDIPCLNSFDKIKFQKMSLKSIKASDLLEDLTLRYRPYVENKSEVEQLKQNRFTALRKIIENGARTKDLVEWGQDTVSLFETRFNSSKQRFPLVLYMGEVYMRQYDPYTNYVVLQLEKNGLEVVRDPLSDWLHYVNEMKKRNTKKNVGLGLKTFNFVEISNETQNLAKALLREKYIDRIENEIAKPFQKILGDRYFSANPARTVETLERAYEFHGDIEGEAILSIGIAYDFLHDLNVAKGDAYISGIFHVAPFTCMQEGVAAAKIDAMETRLRKTKPDIIFPIIHAFFGDSTNENLDSKIAVFKEQCYQKNKILKQKKYAKV